MCYQGQLCILGDSLFFWGLLWQHKCFFFATLLTILKRYPRCSWEGNYCFFSHGLRCCKQRRTKFEKVKKEPKWLNYFVMFAGLCICRSFEHFGNNICFICSPDFVRSLKVFWLCKFYVCIMRNVAVSAFFP